MAPCGSARPPELLCRARQQTVNGRFQNCGYEGMAGRVKATQPEGSKSDVEKVPAVSKDMATHFKGETPLSNSTTSRH